MLHKFMLMLIAFLCISVVVPAVAGDPHKAELKRKMEMRYNPVTVQPVMIDLENGAQAARIEYKVLHNNPKSLNRVYLDYSQQNKCGVPMVTVITEAEFESPRDYACAIDGGTSWLQVGDGKYFMTMGTIGYPYPESGTVQWELPIFESAELQQALMDSKPTDQLKFWMWPRRAPYDAPSVSILIGMNFKEMYNEAYEICRHMQK